MGEMFITEALAELRTISKRRIKAMQQVEEYLTRESRFSDPLDKKGGSEEFIKGRLQAIEDLETRHLEIRNAIRAANEATLITVEGITRPVNEWLNWKKEVQKEKERFINRLANLIHMTRTEFIQKEGRPKKQEDRDKEPNELIVNLDEGELQEKIDQMETIRERLDGQLSLTNATVKITLEDKKILDEN